MHLIGLDAKRKRPVLAHLAIQEERINTRDAAASANTEGKGGNVIYNTVEAVVFTEQEAEHYCETYPNHWFEKINQVDEITGAVSVVYVVYKESGNE